LTNQPTIDIDLDGVIYPPFSEIVSDFIYADSFKRYPREATTWNFPAIDWNMSDAEFNMWVMKGLEADYIFHEGFPVDGAVDGLRALDDAGFRIRIVTQRLGWPSFHGKIIANTAHWLDWWRIPYHSIWFQGKGDTKHTDGVWLLDDRVENVKAHRNGVLFAQKHNLHGVGWSQVVHSWPEFVELVTP
jgi:hypothetical protein